MYLSAIVGCVCQPHMFGDAASCLVSALHHTNCAHMCFVLGLHDVVVRTHGMTGVQQGCAWVRALQTFSHPHMSCRSHPPSNTTPVSVVAVLQPELVAPASGLAVCNHQPRSFSVFALCRTLDMTDFVEFAMVRLPKHPG